MVKFEQMISKLKLFLYAWYIAVAFGFTISTNEFLSMGREVGRLGTKLVSIALKLLVLVVVVVVVSKKLRSNGSLFLAVG
jgi:hypothetical protein